MTPFLTNLLLFSPLLALAALILYVFDRADHLRRGSGLIPDPEPEPEPEEEEPPELVDPSDDSEPGPDGLSDIDSGSGPELETPPLPDHDTDADPIATHAHAHAHAHAPAPAPAPAPAQPTPTTARARNVGAKKARSLARRDQRRAYHEFLISQQEERARAAAATAEDDEERVFAEKRRRAAIEEDIEKKQKEERTARLEAERVAELARRRDVDRLKAFVGAESGGRRSWKVAELAEVVGRGEEWVRSFLKVEGMLGMREGVWGMITESGWYVRVGEREIRVLYEELEKKGKMAWGEMAKVIEEAVRA